MNRSLDPRRREGQTLIEFALAFPVLLMVFLGVLEIGWMAFNQTANLNASRAGARAGAIGQPNQIVDQLAKANAYGLPIQNVRVEVTDINGVPTSSAENRDSGNLITVTTEIGYQPIGPLFNFLPGSRAVTISASSSFTID